MLLTFIDPVLNTRWRHKRTALFSRIHMLTNLLLLSGFTGASYAILGLLSYKGIREDRASRGE